jgi:hypothetical protein
MQCLFLILKAISQLVPRPIFHILDNLSCAAFMVGGVLICKIKVCFILSSTDDFTKYKILMYEAFESLECLNDVAFKLIAALAYCDTSSKEGTLT